MDDRDTVHLSVCTRCRPPEYTQPDGERSGHKLATALRDALREEPSNNFALRGVRCMSQCKRPCVVALSAPGKYTLLFGDQDPATAVQDILTLAGQYAASSNGLVPRDQRPKPLQAGILGRIPPIGYSGDEIDPTFSITQESN